MRAITLSLGLILSLPLGMAAQSLSTNNVRRLSMEECVRSAINRNLRLQFQRLNVQLAQDALFNVQGYYDPVFDTRAVHSLSSSEQQTSGSTIVLPGENTAQTLSSGFKGVLPWGLQYDIGADANYFVRTTKGTNGSFTANYDLDTGIVLTQPLLRGFWIDPGRMAIKFDRASIRMEELELINQINQLVRDVQLNYYELVFAVENVGVNQKALQLAQRLAADNRKKVEVGTLAPLDEKQAEAQAATARADLIAALQTAGTQQRVLINLITDNYEEWQNIRLVPSQTLVAVPQTYNLAASWVEALTHRPDFNRKKEELERKGIEVKLRYNQLFPQLDLIGSYGRRGIDQRFSPALADIRDENLPRYSFGIVFSIPLENKAARGNYRIVKHQREQLQVDLKQLHQQILADVEIAVGAAQAEFERAGAAREAAQAAEAAYDAEVKKLENGKSTSFLVLDSQKKLTDAQSLHLRALADYNKALTHIYYNEGTILEHSKIDVKP